MQGNDDNDNTINNNDSAGHGLEIAIIGMAGRFPGADNIDAFWQLLESASEGLQEIDEQALRDEGVSEDTLADPEYVRVGGQINDADCFDASFFGYSPREAEVLDPQQRVFLECAWHALENAGVDPDRSDASIGVFGGAGMNSYQFSLFANSAVREQVSPYELFVSNDKDFLTTRVSYKLNLDGPSMSVQTACSSSLVAVHVACQSLLGGECDMALAGGVAISQQKGYKPQQGGILSADGHCRAFDADANGTVSGNGVGIIVLKRLEDAIAQGDRIDAVIRGSAINNDGALKVSYTAPQVDRQAQVIRDAFMLADVSADSISYVEAHGTGTAMGDPIEVTALTRAFRADTDRATYCALGSVKTNIGHLDAAAGIAGLIKTVLSLKHARIPASLHYQSANPQIDFEDSPFRVNAQTSDWPQTATPRRAGISSFGIGGTNAHVVLEQAPDIAQATNQQVKYTPQVLVCSAKSADALQQIQNNLADKLDTLTDNTDVSLADVSWTLHAGRRALDYRSAIIASSFNTAATETRTAKSVQAYAQPTTVFMFSGQASQLPQMARALYDQQPVFRNALDSCLEHLSTACESDMRQLLLDSEDTVALTETANAQPALFAVEYACAQLWLHCGVKPAAMIGHSLGELVCACIAGVMSLSTACKLVAARGRLMQAMAPGAMLAVPLSSERLNAYIENNQALNIAAFNAPELCAVSGPQDAIDALTQQLNTDGMLARPLHTSHAFHSASMQDAVAPFVQAVAAESLSPPSIPFISCVSGDWITQQQATDPEYWGSQIREPVRFDNGMQRIAALSNAVLIELGPGNTLCTLAGMQLKDGKTIFDARLQTLAGAADANNDNKDILTLQAMAQAWCYGIDIDWSALQQSHASDTAVMPRKVALPLYPFARDRYRITADSMLSLADGSTDSAANSSATQLDMADWFHMPAWQRRPLIASPPTGSERVRWLLFADKQGVADELAESIERDGQDAFRVTAADAFAQSGYRSFTMDAQGEQGFAALFDDLNNRDTAPEQIVWMWSLDAEDDSERNAFMELLALVKSLADRTEPLQITVVSRHACDVLGNETPVLSQAALAGFCQVAGQEYPQIGFRLIDVAANTFDAKQGVELLLHELRAKKPAACSALRGRTRWELDYHATRLPAIDNTITPVRRLRKHGSYVIVGDIEAGLGHIWARGLRQQLDAQVALIDVSVDTLADTSNDETAAEMEGCLRIAAQANVESIVAALDKAAEQHGPIQGVFTSSPITNPSSAAPLALMQQQQWQYNQHSKIDVHQALVEALQSHRPQFVCVQSSMSSVIGGLGLAAYAAANHQLEAISAQHNNTANVPWLVSNWDAWRDENTPAPEPGSLGAALAEFALTPDEIWQATQRIIAMAPAGQVVVSRSALTPRLQQWISATPRILQQEAVGSQSKSTHGSHERPELDTEYVAPRDDVETTIANIWQQSLGINKVGVEDNFFELGGHSLLAIQIIGKLREAFPVDIEIQQLLGGNPTVANIASALRERLPQQDELAAMSELLAEIQAEDNVDKAAGGQA